MPQLSVRALQAGDSKQCRYRTVHVALKGHISDAPTEAEFTLLACNLVWSHTRTCPEALP